jgi:hypothetical protein
VEGPDAALVCTLDAGAVRLGADAAHQLEPLLGQAALRADDGLHPGRGGGMQKAICGGEVV